MAPPKEIAGTQGSHPFTCNTCQVAFRSSDLQRTHMQSDWHRYNLKRRVASLPPLTSEIFAEKVLANKASAAATAARASFERICPACTKTYFSENAFQNHLGSQKHKAQVVRLQVRQGLAEDAETGSMVSSTFSLGEPLDTASTISAPPSHADTMDITRGLQSTSIGTGDDRPVTEAVQNLAAEAESVQTTPNDQRSAISVDKIEMPLAQCLFCNLMSENTEHNIRHMSKQHGMYIPERDYLVDLDGLLRHLQEVIFDFYECLYCHQAKYTSTGAQTHMRDRGHCMIAYEKEEEMLSIGEYYDFRSTYSDAEDSEGEERDSRAGMNDVKLGVKRATKISVENGQEGDDELVDDGEEDSWESDASSLSSVPTDEITAMPIDDHSHRYKTLANHHHHSHNDPRPHRSADGFHSHAHPMPRAVYHDEYELHLPSGRTAGHRSLNKYFRQNLNRSSLVERAQRQQRAIEGRHDSDDEMEDAGDVAVLTNNNNRDRGRQIIARANRELGMTGVTDAKRREVQAVEKRDKKAAERAQRRYEWGNNKRSNHQKHYRDPLLQ